MDEIFDAISYCKGSAVINMIWHTIGEGAFQEGLRQYFKRHAYGNTVTSDLWRAWSEASAMDVTAMMSCWTEQMG